MSAFLTWIAASAAAPASLASPAVPPSPQPSSAALPTAPFGFLTARKLVEQCVLPSTVGMTTCFSFIAGIHDAVRAYEVWLGQPEFCAPQNVSQGELRQAFLSYTSSNPASLSGQAASVVVVALKAAYPCAKAR